MNKIQYYFGDSEKKLSDKELLKLIAPISKDKKSLKHLLSLIEMKLFYIEIKKELSNFRRD